MAAVCSVVSASPALESVQPASAAEPGPSVRSIIATAYCLDGTMANGEPTHAGAAAMSGVPLGTTVSILDGPDAGRAVVIKDRLHKDGVLDIWMDDCGAARAHGARQVTIQLQI